MTNNYLLQQIRQDFSILKTLLSDNFKLAQFLKIDFADAAKIVETLKTCKENAHIELKLNYLKQISTILDDALYKMITPGKLNDTIKTIDLLLFLTAINIKAISQKKYVKIKTPENYDASNFDIRHIIKELPLLSKEMPETNMYIRVISNLLKKYRDTMIEMDEKIIIAPEKTRESISKTYKLELETLIASIKKHYYNMIMSIPNLKKKFEEEHSKKTLEPDNETDEFYTYDYAPLKHHLTKELSEYSKIRSSLLYIKKESMDVLSTIKDIYTNQHLLMQLTSQEESAIFNVMSINNISVEQFNIFLFRISDEIINFIDLKFINPYTRK